MLAEDFMFGFGDELGGIIGVNPDKALVSVSAGGQVGVSFFAADGVQTVQTAPFYTWFFK